LWLNVVHATNEISVSNQVLHTMAALRTRQRYATILEVNQAAITQPGINEVFSGACQAVKKVLPYDRMGLSLYVPDKGALKLAATEGCSPDSFYRTGLMLDCKETHHGWVFQHKQAILRRDLQKEIEFQIEQQNLMEGVRSYCAVPLIVRGDSLGVMIILSSQKNCYSTEHAEFLQEVSDQVSLAVKSLMPSCSKHFGTNLVCPRCIASAGGRTTAVKHKAQLSGWGKQGGRGRKKSPGGGVNM
jgi:transcriptional regulator with GAF, ATPase, and Fis domain